MNFNDIIWHDSIVKTIIIDRSLPGYADTVKFEIYWGNNNHDELIFEHVYWASFNLNFGIVADESISNAYETNVNDCDLTSLYKKWGGLINNVELTAYTIELNSTGGLIKIIAKNVKIAPFEDQ